MFRLENVSKVYSRRGSVVLAFSVETMRIPTGEYAAVLGPSGSGKTTLLSMLGGMLSPSTGQVWIGDVDMYDLTIAERARLRRQKIGFVFQTFNLVPYLTALENVQVPLSLSDMSEGDQRELAVSLLWRVGLGDRLDHRPRELSIGQQQRVALARTIANNPAVILADEPTGNLDPESREMVLDFFDELRESGCTIVMVTHDMAAADRARIRLRLSAGTVVPIETSASKVA